MTTTQPQWHATDPDTATLLDLLADDGSAVPSKAEEWDLYVFCLRDAAWGVPGTNIDPNSLRAIIHRRIKPQRIGAFTRRAILEGLVEYTGRWVISDDTEGKNAGKPCRELRWLGGAA